MIDNRPFIEEHLEFFYHEFLLLSSRRGSGMNGPAPLVGEEIDRRVRRHGLTGCEADRYVDFVEYLDRVYLAFDPEATDG